MYRASLFGAKKLQCGYDGSVGRVPQRANAFFCRDCFDGLHRRVTPVRARTDRCCDVAGHITDYCSVKCANETGSWPRWWRAFRKTWRFIALGEGEDPSGKSPGEGGVRGERVPASPQSTGPFLSSTLPRKMRSRRFWELGLLGSALASPKSEFSFFFLEARVVRWVYICRLLSSGCGIIFL